MFLNTQPAPLPKKKTRFHDMQCKINIFLGKLCPLLIECSHAVNFITVSSKMSDVTYKKFHVRSPFLVRLNGKVHELVSNQRIGAFLWGIPRDKETVWRQCLHSEIRDYGRTSCL